MVTKEVTMSKTETPRGRVVPPKTAPKRAPAKRTRGAEMTVSEPVRCGQPTTISGKGWTAAGSVRLVLDGVRTLRVRVGGRGEFSTDIVLSERGQHRIEVSQAKTVRSLTVQAGA